MTNTDNKETTEATIESVEIRPTIVRDLSELAVQGHKFRTVLADPPWRYDNKSSRGAAANHYRTMTVEEICRQLEIPAAAETKAELLRPVENSIIVGDNQKLKTLGFHPRYTLAVSIQDMIDWWRARV